jgi:hypothetical protein
MAKKNLSKLVKKLITDKKGKRTSVWVRAGVEPKKEKKQNATKLQIKEYLAIEKQLNNVVNEMYASDADVAKKMEQQADKLEGMLDKIVDSIAKREGISNTDVVDKINKMSEGSSESDEVKQISPKKKRTIKERLSDLSQKLYSKVKRREKGKGGEISLTSNEVKELLAKGRLGFISAGKNPADPRDMKLSDEDIEKRYGKLKDELVELGYVFIPVRGKYGEEEDSYMVMIPEAEKSDLNKLGKKYNQDSVIYAEKGHNELRFTTGENAGKHNDGDGFEQVQDAKDFFTEVKTKDGVLKFRLNIDFDKLLKALGNFIQILRV